MTSDTSRRPVSPLRARMIEDMTVRGFSERTRGHYVRHVRAFAAFIGRSLDMATAEDLRLFQLHQTRIGMQPPSINGAVSALRFFFTVTLDRPDLSRRLTVGPYPRRIPAVLSIEEVTLLLGAASAPKKAAAHRAARPPALGSRPDPMTFLLVSWQHPFAGTSRSRRRTCFIPAWANIARAPRASSQSARRIRRQPPVRNHQRLSALSNLKKTISRQRRCCATSP